MSTTAYQGDDIIVEPEMHYNQIKHINATPDEIFPWVVQLGKGRAGWYLTTSWEKWCPKGWAASRTIIQKWQELQVGDRVADYGFSAEDYFDVVYLDHEKTTLVYKSERLGTVFTWALIVSGLGNGRSELRLRFRGRIHRTGLGRKLLVFFGEYADWVTTAPMLNGLKERAEKVHSS